MLDVANGPLEKAQNQHKKLRLIYYLLFFNAIELIRSEIARLPF
jgi:hypothetical protein